MFHRSARLFLRPPFMEDAAGLAVAMGDRAIARNLARVPWPYTPADARAWMSAPRDPRLPSLLVTLPDQGGSIIGGCGLHETAQGPELGFWIARPCWGRGYATEAAAALLELAAALGHRRVNGYHAADDPAAQKVLRKLGFQPTGQILRRSSLARPEAFPAHEHALVLASQSSVARAA